MSVICNVLINPTNQKYEPCTFNMPVYTNYVMALAVKNNITIFHWSNKS